MNCLTFRYCFPVALLAVSASASAIGLGELRGQPALGDRLQVEVGLLGGGKEVLDASCYRLVQPANGGDLPWLKKAVLSTRNGNPPVLEIKSDIPLREPIMQFAVHVACGNDISRDYVILASPARDVAPESSPRAVARELPSQVQGNSAKAASRPAAADRGPVVSRPSAPRSRPVGRNDAGKGLPDRLMLSTGIDVGDPSLRLATDIAGMGRQAGAGQSVEAQREVLRLEYRMLMALHEQANTQMATAEKLRNMEGTLAELEQRTLEIAQRSEKEAAQGVLPVAGAQPVGDSATPVAPVPAPTAPPASPPPAVADSSSDLSEWGLYGLLSVAVLALGGLLGWRNYRERQLRNIDSDDLFVAPGLEVDPKRDEEHEELGGVDLPVEPGMMGSTMKVDLELDGHDTGEVVSNAPQAASDSLAEAQLDSVFSVNATTLDEHFEANPVMELADIMLSFGRVKGAAQALQEYIDNNPQEALQPWIRLMDVYKMAGMRNEFEAVALNLNQNFNVEIQQWDGSEPSQNRHSLDLILDDEVPVSPVPVAPRPECLEDMPRIMASVTQFWSSGDVVGYLYQLLRDNRGGKRVGFALPVVEEILFLIELKETSNRMEREVEGA